MAIGWNRTNVSAENWKLLLEHPIWQSNYYTMGIMLTAMQDFNIYEITAENWEKIAVAYVTNFIEDCARWATREDTQITNAQWKADLSARYIGVKHHIGYEFWYE